LSPLRTWQPEPLHWALLASVLLHVMLITALGFAHPAPRRDMNQLPVLDIVLVNAKTKETPKQADVLAQSNLDRGGNTSQDKRMKTPLPPPKKQQQTPAFKPDVEPRETRVRQEAAQTPADNPPPPKPVAEQEKRVEQVMTQAESPQVVDSLPLQQARATEPEQGQQTEPPRTIDTADLMARSLEAARLEALIAKNMEAYQKRPKRKFIGGRAAEYRFAAYIEAWRQKVERIGNLNYPEAAKQQKLYGRLQLTVSIRADGSVESVEVTRSSGHPVLDDAARRIVQMGAPYAEFPPDIRKDTDILDIVRTWTFTREDTLASGD